MHFMRDYLETGYFGIGEPGTKLLHRNFLGPIIVFSSRILEDGVYNTSVNVDCFSDTPADSKIIHSRDSGPCFYYYLNHNLILEQNNTLFVFNFHCQITSTIKLMSHAKIQHN